MEKSEEGETAWDVKRAGELAVPVVMNGVLSGGVTGKSQCKSDGESVGNTAPTQNGEVVGPAVKDQPAPTSECVSAVGDGPSLKDSKVDIVQVVNGVPNGHKSEDEKTPSDDLAKPFDAKSEAYEKTCDSAPTENDCSESVSNSVDSSTESKDENHPASSNSVPSISEDSPSLLGQANSVESNSKADTADSDCSASSSLIPSTCTDSCKPQASPVAEDEKSAQVSESRGSETETVVGLVPPPATAGENNETSHSGGEKEAADSIDLPSSSALCNTNDCDVDRSSVSQSEKSKDSVSKEHCADESVAANEKSEGSGKEIVDGDKCANDTSSTAFDAENDQVSTEIGANVASISQPLSASTDRASSPSCPNKTTARKSLPDRVKGRFIKATARKTGQPQTVLKPIISGKQESDKDTIKIVNLHPNSNITLKLSELEKVLKVKDAPKTASESVSNKDDKETGSDACRQSSGQVVSDAASGTHSVDAGVSVHFGMKGQHKRRRKRVGTYDFPGKKLQKKKRCSVGMDNRTALESRDDDDDEEDDDEDFVPLKKVSTNKKVKVTSPPRRQYTMVELLKNRPFHRRISAHDAMHWKSPEKAKTTTTTTMSQMLKDRLGSYPKQKTVTQLLQEKRLKQASEESPAGTPQGSKQTVQELFVSSTVTKEGLLSSVNIENVKEMKNSKQQSLKRKFPGGTTLVRTGSTDGSGAKRRRLSEGEDTPMSLMQPMVMVVAQHSNSPGLRSILPKPNRVPASVVTAGPLTSAPGGQRLQLLSAQPLLVKPGTKVALVPASATGKPPAYSLLPASRAATPASKGVAVPLSAVPTLAKVMNFRQAVPQSALKTSDALRALLCTNGPKGRIERKVGPALPVTSSMTTVFLTSSQTKLPIVATAASLTSGSKGAGLDAKAVPLLPNGLLPVTPPKTPEGEATAEGMSKTPNLESDALPLCCCKVVGPFLNKLSTGATYCQALDSVDGKVLGCCNKVSNLQLVRPGVKIPFMAVCEVHRKRLRLHQCCPGCGHFCTQGKFYQCRKEGTSVHNFHKLCQTERDGRLFCPHCGEESGQVEVTLALNEPQPCRQSAEEIRANLRKTLSKARMTPSSVKKKSSGSDPAQSGVSLTLPNSKTLSSGGLPVGPQREGLEKLMHLCINKAERPKKYRVLPRYMYGPATEGDLDKVFYMLMDGMDPNQVCEEEDNQTVLHGAVYSGNLALVYLLVQAGACLHTPDKTLKTPLMCAAEYGFVSVLRLLAKAGARLDDRGEDRMTCLHYAAKAGHLDIIQYMMDIEAIDVNATDEGGWTPIMWATESQLVDVVKFLVSRGGDPSKKDNEENTALHWAAFAGSVEITELFLDLGCELDTPNEHGDRPLHIAARQDHYEVVVILLARGASVELKNNKDETPVSCCPNPTGQVCMALKINRQLRSFCKQQRPERLMHRDLSVGRERNPIACVNSVDEEQCPGDYLYVNHNVETQDLHINNVITSLQSCRCKDDCSSVYCVCSRSSVKCWFDKFGRLLEEFNLLDPPLIFECNRACRCWVNCNNRVVQNGITVRLQVFRTSGRGWGVRSLMDIPKGTFICEYIGELISDSEADRREDDSYLFDLDNKDGDTYCLDARKYGNVARFINHLCEPNLVPVKVFIDHQDLRFPRICFFSSRDIKAYEEFGFDYGEKFWIIKWKQFTCACGSPKCKYSVDTIQRTLAEYRQRHEEEDIGQET